MSSDIFCFILYRFIYHFSISFSSLIVALTTLIMVRHRKLFGVFRIQVRQYDIASVGEQGVKPELSCRRVCGIQR